MSVIRLISSPDSAATPYPPTQAGLDAAIAASNAAGGGIIEMSTGLESLAIAGIGSGTVVIRWRATTPLAMELFGANFILDNGQSYRIKDSGGTNRTVLRVSGDFTDLAAVGANGLRFIKNDGTVWLGPVTGTRFPLVAGQDFAPNNLPGTVGDVLTSQGAGASPIYTKPAGIPGSTMYVGLPAKIWYNAPTLGGTNNTWIGDSAGAGGTYTNFLKFTVPTSYTGPVAWKVIWKTTGSADGGTVSWRLGMLKYVAGSGTNLNSPGTTYTFGTTQTDTAPGTTFTYATPTTVGTPSVTVAPGDEVMLQVQRPAAGSAFAVDFLGMQLVYN